ncbi:MAG: hypothetical protein HYX26_10130 [Acidobacteriales bacterium]|nr:hypothetical protein [Terriglobales bacterium]
MESTRQGTTLYTAILILVGTVVVIQLWLVTAAMDALLGADNRSLIPLAVGSFVLFLINAGLLMFVFHFDRRLQRVSGSKL